MNVTSFGSTAIFVGIIFCVAGLMGWIFCRAGYSKRVVWVGLIIWLLIGVGFVLLTNLLGPAAQVAGLAPIAVIGVGIAFTKLGLRLTATTSLAMLAAFQAFRLPLELILDQWYREGVMPVQMTFHGDNLDIITGIVAVPASILIARGIGGKIVPWVFNIFGLALLFRVISIVMLSSPTPMRTFFGGYQNGPEVLLALTVPHIWIATIAVFSAMVWHTISLQRLWHDRNAQPNG